jgi:hypothetical protein
VKIIAFQLSLFKDCPLKKIHWCLKIPDLFLSYKFQCLLLQMDTTVNELSQVMSGLSSAESSPAKATKSLSGSFVDVEPKRLFTVKDDQ